MQTTDEITIEHSKPKSRPRRAGTRAARPGPPATAETHAKALGPSLEWMRPALARIAHRVSTVEADLHGARSEAETLKSVVGKLEEQRDDLRRRLETLRGRVEEMEAERRTIMTLRHERDRLQRELDALQAQSKRARLWKRTG